MKEKKIYDIDWDLVSFCDSDIELPDHKELEQQVTHSICGGNYSLILDLVQVLNRDRDVEFFQDMVQIIFSRHDTEWIEHIDSYFFKFVSEELEVTQVFLSVALGCDIPRMQRAMLLNLYLNQRMYIRCLSIEHCRTYIRWIRRGGLEPYNLHQQNRRFSMLTDKMFQTILQAAEKGDEQTYTYYLCYASDIENIPDTDMVLESILTSVLYQINDLHDPVLLHYILHKLQNPIRTFLMYIEEENMDALCHYALDCIRLDLLFMILWFLTPKSRQVQEADCWLKKNAEHLQNLHLQSLYEQWSQEIQDFALVPDNAEQIECIF